VQVLARSSSICNRDRSTSTDIVLHGDFPDVSDDLSTEGRVQATGGFVEEENLGICYQPTRHPQPLLLSTAEALLDGGSDDGVRLSLQTKAGDEVVNAGESFFLGDVTITLLEHILPAKEAVSIEPGQR
jgi:hypothetical protein